MLEKSLRFVFAASDLVAALFLFGGAMIGFTGGRHASVTPDMVFISLLFAAYGVGFCISARDVRRGLPRQRWLRPILYGLAVIGMATILTYVWESDYQRTEATVFLAVLAVSGIGHFIWAYKQRPAEPGR
jgi:hypothetical protein